MSVHGLVPDALNAQVRKGVTSPSPKLGCVIGQVCTLLGWPRAFIQHCSGTAESRRMQMRPRWSRLCKPGAWPYQLCHDGNTKVTDVPWGRGPCQWGWRAV